MALITFKLWNKDFSEYDIVQEVPFAPCKGDEVLFNDKWYIVVGRGIDLDTGKYTKIHCKEE